jgi:hypothetical protein
MASKNYINWAVKDRRNNSICFEGSYAKCKDYIKMQRQGWGPYPPSGDAQHLYVTELVSWHEAMS